MKFDIKLKRLCKYILFGLIISLVLKYFSGTNIKSSNILTYTLLILLSIIIINRYIFKQIEYMSILNDINNDINLDNNSFSYNKVDKLLNNKKQRYIMNEYRNYKLHIPTIQLGKDRNYLEWEHNH